MTRQALTHAARPLAPIRGETVYAAVYGINGAYQMPVTIPVVMAMRPKDRPPVITWIVDLNGEGAHEQPQAVLDLGRRGRGFRKRALRGR